MRNLSLCIAVCLAASAVPLHAEPMQNPIRIRVTVQNGTAGNVLSPYLVAVHGATESLFQVGMPASPGISRIAETGDTSLLEQELDMAKTTVGRFKVEGGPIFSGEMRSVDFSLSAADKNRSVLSLVAMIGRSNDSFIALKNIDLKKIKGSMTLMAQNYDAGSEENSGNMEDFGPGGHPTANAELKVSYDRGLNPRGNAPESWTWGPVAALVTIEVLH